MTTIAQTLLATHDPATVAQTQRAIPYVEDASIPDNAAFSVRLPVSVTGYSLYGLLKGEADFDILLEGGFGKTCWGARLEAAGEVDEDDPTSAYLTITNDDFVAGKILGVDTIFTFRYTMWKIHHHGLWKHSWDKEYDSTFGPYRLDLLTTLYSIVQAAIQLGDVIPFGDIIGALLPQNVGASGFFDRKSGIVDAGGSLTLTPQVVGDIDLVHLAEMCGFDLISAVFLLFPPAELPVQGLTRLAELGLNLLQFVTPVIAFGPSFGFGSPVDISIADFTVNDVTYTVSGVDSFSPPRLVGRASSPPDTPFTDLGIHFHAVPKDAVYLGVFAQITWLKILSKEWRHVWDVYAEAGITAFNDDPVDTEFSNDVGARNLANSSILTL